jgi:hypothetical protein
MTTLWSRIAEGVDAGLAATLGAVKAAGEKAAETSHVAQQKYQRSALQGKIMRNFGELGSKIYEKALREDVKNPMEDPEVQALIAKIKVMDQDLARMEATIEKEAREKDKPQGTPEAAAPDKTEPSVEDTIDFK